MATFKAMIEEAASKEEVLQIQAGSGEAGADKATKEKKPVQAFAYSFDDKAVAVPSFKWKEAQGAEKLRDYATALKSLLEKIEEKLNRA